MRGAIGWLDMGQECNAACRTGRKSGLADRRDQCIIIPQLAEMLGTICARCICAAVALCSMVVSHIEVDATSTRVHEDAPSSN
eukprot:COSAG02_NODE_4728_length_5045_cov_9.058835_4_plen_83_part_00